MKYLGISGGWLMEEFVLIPCISFRKMTLKDGAYIYMFLSWLFWYINIGQIKNKLKENGYY